MQNAAYFGGWAQIASMDKLLTEQLYSAFTKGDKNGGLQVWIGSGGSLFTCDLSSVLGLLQDQRMDSD
jgi:hypothetical protein